jgi:hypothetical protein
MLALDGLGCNPTLSCSAASAGSLSSQRAPGRSPTAPAAPASLGGPLGGEEESSSSSLGVSQLTLDWKYSESSKKSGLSTVPSAPRSESDLFAADERAAVAERNASAAASAEGAPSCTRGAALTPPVTFLRDAEDHNVKFPSPVEFATPPRLSRGGNTQQAQEGKGDRVRCDAEQHANCSVAERSLVCRCRARQTSGHTPSAYTMNLINRL